jgi:hypothetical protein
MTVRVENGLLKLYRGPERIDGTPELGKRAVSGQLD